MAARWEYLVHELGGALRSAKPEALEQLLNEAAGQGWEPVDFVQPNSNTNRLWAILRRPQAGRRRERVKSWP